MLACWLQVELPEGQLVISPLRERWLQQTGDLLADTFVDAKGIQPYRSAQQPKTSCTHHSMLYLQMPCSAHTTTCCTC